MHGESPYALWQHCYLVLSDQLIFYRVVGESHVEVTRVLNGRQDYISILF